MSNNWNEHYDVVVVGSGAGGLTAALTAQLKGLSTIVIEKTQFFGGSTSKSGGTIWIPNNIYLENEVIDSYENAKTYLNETVGNRVPESLKDAYLTKGPEMVEFLHNYTTYVRWDFTPDYSDYYPEKNGGLARGRAIEARMFDLRNLGDNVDNLRPAGLPTKGMVLNSSEFHKVNMIMRTWVGKMNALKVGMRLIRTLATTYNPTTLGEALVARLYKSLKEADGDVWVSTPFVDAIMENDKVAGVIAKRNGELINIKANHGVVFAAGGFSHSQELRDKYLPKPTNVDWTLASEGQVGDVLQSGLKLGAKVDLMEKMWGTPTSSPPGAPAFMPVAERATPGLIIVNQAGKRYINESVPYHEFVDTMYEKNSDDASTVPSWMILDQRVKNRYLVFGIMPLQPFPKNWLEEGYVKVGQTPEELAKQINVNPENLATTIKHFNQLAKSGVDKDFHRGESAYDRYYGDPTLKNPNLAPLDKAPFYAIPIYPGDIGTKGGLVTDDSARVLDKDDKPIKGLYAAGNTAAAIMGETYPGPGATIGSAMVFGYAAAKDIKKNSK